MTPDFAIRALCALIASAFCFEPGLLLGLAHRGFIPASAARDVLRRKALASPIRSVLTVKESHIWPFRKWSYQ